MPFPDQGNQSGLGEVEGRFLRFPCDLPQFGIATNVICYTLAGASKFLSCGREDAGTQAPQQLAQLCIAEAGSPVDVSCSSYFLTLATILYFQNSLTTWERYSERVR